MTRVQFPVAEYILFILSKMVAQCGAFPDGKAVIAQLGERQTEDLEVLGSIPSPGIIVADGSMFGRFVLSRIWTKCAV